MRSPAETTNTDGGGAALAKAVRVAVASPGADDRPFAIMRYAKLRSVTSIKGSSKHMRRDIPTPNADASISANNPILIGTDDPAADVLRLVPKVGARQGDPENGKLLRRSNSVLAVEVLMTTSPEWWRSSTRADRDAWVAQSTAWLVAEWGEENVAHLEFHLDETTPHLTGLIVPLDPDTGGLNARRWIGGKASKMNPGTSLISGHQTRYAEAVEDLGLRRGLMGSTATHQSVAEYYRRVNASDDVDLPDITTPPIFGREKWANDLRAQVHEAIKVKAAKAAELPVEHRKSVEARRAAEINGDALERAKEARRALSDQMRALPLASVLDALGLAVDPKDARKPENRQRWIAGPEGNRTHKIEIDGDKWRCIKGAKGARGAIDLVKYVTETDFNGALSWLADRFGTDATAADLLAAQQRRVMPTVEAAVKERPPFNPPAADPESWPAVRRHLIEERALDADIVDAAHDAGDLYAQSRIGPHGGQLVNAVFVQRDADGIATGAEIKGIAKLRDGSRFSALAPGSDKKRGAFRAGLREIGDAVRVVIVESAIDALSALGLIRRKAKKASPITIISTAGDGNVPEPILAAITADAKRFAGQDRNAAGDAQAAALGDGWKRLPPALPHEDWNDWAVAEAKARSGGGTDPWASAPSTDAADEASDLTDNTTPDLAP